MDSVTKTYTIPNVTNTELAAAINRHPPAKEPHNARRRRKLSLARMGDPAGPAGVKDDGNVGM
ncbi:MAG: hypothetical protein NPIRA03_24720 [Nitrospirales bacterium]|nr:MAG: hypothetical protein NPIRA03_24720 [Nitrospirales bacterium]